MNGQSTRGRGRGGRGGGRGGFHPQNNTQSQWPMQDNTQQSQFPYTSPRLFRQWIMFCDLIE
ncbi:hypothetical protein PFICI_06297 [Pestalotiopsis fici W106-1]|uniref:Uncharacterized protein n=1 Tax=Pestalotiopsis fici (strain W106-1 / CGMCC3.15140) TaxID=1229662 RepID=W3X5H2_PESFW|nr:uncharacterized protein PFICI_06297 [Pestalotiopsis fici W106-1]ETS81295.1 hypothetical protein PFICI_06297 [Pestalotiopsis fici W106-1]